MTSSVISVVEPIIFMLGNNLTPFTGKGCESPQLFPFGLNVFVLKEHVVKWIIVFLINSLLYESFPIFRFNEKMD